MGLLQAALYARRIGICTNPAALLRIAVRGLHTILLRDEGYNQLNESDIDHFRTILDERDVITDPETLAPYNRDWLWKYTGCSTLALRPRTTEAVSQILAYCSLKRLAVVPQGGNTGLVGGSVPVFDEVVVSLSGMNKILSIDPVSGVLVCQAGCILQSLDDALAEHGLMMPLDLGAKGSCHIGGNVSTNAGGLRLLRYGSLHGSVLGLEVVMADGTTLDLLRTLRKDNTGPDLKQLFIGSEGTLGVVTAVSVQCVPRPPSIQLAFLQCPSFQAVQDVLRMAKGQLGEILSAVEFLDAASMDLVTKHLEGVRNPIGAAGQQEEQQEQQEQGAAGGSAADSSGGPFYMCVETHGSSAEHDMEKLSMFLESAMESGAVINGTLAENSTQAAGIWRVREGITEALTRRGAVYKYDLSMPVPEMYRLVEEMRYRMAGVPDAQVMGYGHVGDGNLHLNISCPGGYSQEVEERIEPFVYEWTAARGGSISAEHGLGLMKAGCIGYSKSREAVELMRKLKQLMDPHGILNPYKVLPPQEPEDGGEWSSGSD